MRFKKLLAAIDFSPPSRTAFHAAVAMAADTGAELVLLHVVHPVVSPAGAAEFPPTWTERDYVGTARATLETWKREASEAGARNVTARVVLGVPWHAITEQLLD